MRVLAERVIRRTALAETLGLLALPEMRELRPRGCPELFPEALLETVVLAVVAVLAVIGGTRGELPTGRGVHQFAKTLDPPAPQEMLGVEPAALLPVIALKVALVVAGAQAHVIMVLLAQAQQVVVALMVARAVMVAVLGHAEAMKEMPHLVRAALVIPQGLAVVVAVAVDR